MLVNDRNEQNGFPRFSGHSDVLMGAVALNDDTLAAEFKNLQDCMFAVMHKFSDCQVVMTVYGCHHYKL